MANIVVRNVPNAITCSNLICGCVAICFAIVGEPQAALMWMLAGAVFDFFDGMSARLLHVSSPMGVELDSLADVITFGLAPSMIVFSELSVVNYPSFLGACRSFLPCVAFLMAAFSALRLAKFNIDKRQTTSFLGLATPANALFWASLIVYCPRWMESSAFSPVIIILLMLLSCYLLVSEIPMFALKFRTLAWKENSVKYIFLTLSLFILLFLGILRGMWLVIICYVLISCVVNLLNRNQGVAGERKG